MPESESLEFQSLAKAHRDLAEAHLSLLKLVERSEAKFAKLADKDISGCLPDAAPAIPPPDNPLDSLSEPKIEEGVAANPQAANTGSKGSNRLLYYTLVGVATVAIYAVVKPPPTPSQAVRDLMEQFDSQRNRYELTLHQQSRELRNTQKALANNERALLQTQTALRVAQAALARMHAGGSSAAPGTQPFKSVAVNSFAVPEPPIQGSGTEPTDTDQIREDALELKRIGDAILQNHAIAMTNLDEYLKVAKSIVTERQALAQLENSIAVSQGRKANAIPPIANTVPSKETLAKEEADPRIIGVERGDDPSVIASKIELAQSQLADVQSDALQWQQMLDSAIHELGAIRSKTAEDENWLRKAKATKVSSGSKVDSE